MSCSRDVSAVKGCMWSPPSGSEGCAEATAGSSRSAEREAREGKERETENTKRLGIGRAPASWGQRRDAMRAERRSPSRQKKAGGRRKDAERKKFSSEKPTVMLISSKWKHKPLFSLPLSSRIIEADMHICVYRYFSRAVSRNSNKRHYPLWKFKSISFLVAIIQYFSSL